MWAGWLFSRFSYNNTISSTTQTNEKHYHSMVTAADNLKRKQARLISYPVARPVWRETRTTRD